MVENNGVNSLFYYAEEGAAQIHHREGPELPDVLKQGPSPSEDEPPVPDMTSAQSETRAPQVAPEVVLAVDIMKEGAHQRSFLQSSTSESEDPGCNAAGPAAIRPEGEVHLLGSSPGPGGTAPSAQSSCRKNPLSPSSEETKRSNEVKSCRNAPTVGEKTRRVPTPPPPRRPSATGSNNPSPWPRLSAPAFQATIPQQSIPFVLPSGPPPAFPPPRGGDRTPTAAGPPPLVPPPTSPPPLPGAMSPITRTRRTPAFPIMTPRSPGRGGRSTTGEDARRTAAVTAAVRRGGGSSPVPARARTPHNVDVDVGPLQEQVATRGPLNAWNEGLVD